MDTFVLNAICQELRQHICPSRINSICQPDEYSLVLVLWHRGKEHQLAISVDARYQYLFLTTKLPENKVLSFGKFLQHHIKGAEIHQLHKPPLERILTFDIVKKDIDGQERRFQLILEVMGRHSNFILINQETNKIFDSIRHVTAVQSSYRRIAPGARYVPPPQQEKDDVTAISKEEFQHILRDYEIAAEKTPKLRLWKFLIGRMRGLSPLIAKEIEGQNLDHDDDARWKRFSRIIQVLKSGEYQPVLVMEEDVQGKERPLALSALPLAYFLYDRQITTSTPESMNVAAEQYYSLLIERQEYESLKNSLLSPLSVWLSKLKKKQKHLLAQREQIDNAEEFKHKGELITANIYQLTRGMHTARVIDYYSEDQTMIEIALDPKFTPSQNAQRYFKRYNKLKQGKDVTEQRLLETEQEIAYLEERKFFVDDAETLEDLKKLQDEFKETKQPEGKKKTKKKIVCEKPVKPFLRFVSSDGLDIYVGRSSKENDLLTQRTALAEDIWLHVRDAPGSHVLILNRERNTPVPEQTLIEAASFAVYYSKLRHSGKADVMYTQKKYVKKPKGSPPGLVTLSKFQTIRVTPQAKI